MNPHGHIVERIRRPYGPLGRLAARVMALRPALRLRDAWTVDLLDPGPRDAVLEIGCGSGYVLDLCVARVPGGRVVGVDRSAARIERARERHAAGRRAGRVALERLGVDRLGELAGPFDRIYSVDLGGLVAERDTVFAEIGALAAPGARLAASYLPCRRDAPRDEARRIGWRAARAAARAGFGGVEIRERRIGRRVAVCVIGRRS